MDQMITAISVQKKNSERVNIFLDGEFAFGLSRVTAAWLQVGQHLTPEKITQLRSEDEYEIAFQKSIRYLSYQPRTEKEVRQKLESYSYSDEVVDAVISRLRKIELVDDHRYARDWVENRFEFRPRSKRALNFELNRRGINQEIIDSVLKDVDEPMMALRAASKQFHKYKECSWEEFRKKMYAFLARRGFDYETSARVIKSVWEENTVEEKTIENEADI